MEVNNLIIADTECGLKSVFKKEEEKKHYTYKYSTNGVKGIVTCIDTTTTYQDVIYGLKAVHAVYERKPIQTKKEWLEQYSNCKINLETILSYSEMRGKMFQENNLSQAINPNETTEEEILEVLNYVQSLNVSSARR